jgi:hypothetical protein
VRRSWRDCGCLLAAAGLLIAGCSQGSTSTVSAAETCTVWWSATDTNISAEGSGAKSECVLIARCRAGCEMSGYLAAPDGRVLCRYHVHGLTYTVRERALLPIEQQAVSWCDGLRRGLYPDATTDHMNAPPDPPTI